jgi:hypothetical protein
MRDHSPIIVWLLAAATLCVDVALRWSSADSYINYAELAYFALLSGQLSVVCIWATLRRDSNQWTHAAPVVAAIAASVAFKRNDQILDFAVFFGAQAAAIVVGLWLFRRSRYWQQRSGVETDWQFSIAQLLIVTTAVALLTVGFKRSSLWDDGGDDTAMFFGYVGCSTVLAIAAVYTWSQSAHWLLRLAAVLGVAFGLSAVFLIGDRFMFAFAAAHFIIEGVVLSVWLTWGQILPLGDGNDVAETQPTT